MSLSDDSVAATRYLRQAKSCFFRWDDDGQELLWDTGMIIAFRQELVAVLRRLAVDGLPPLNAIAVLMSAFRSSYASASDIMRLFDDVTDEVLFDREDARFGVSVIPPIRHLLGDRWSELDAIDEVRGHLRRISEFPESLRSSVIAKAELAAMVFEGTKATVPSDDAALIADIIEAGVDRDHLSSGGIVRLLLNPYRDAIGTRRFDRHRHRINLEVTVRRDIEQLLKEMMLLRDGLRLVTEDALRLRIETGLHRLPHAVGEDFDPATSARALIRRLIDEDQELAGMAGIARQLLPVVQLPRRLTDIEDLPLGGVSDICHRGPLDRLLLSELANDDLTLSVRVAMNEAMYLRRESPPHNPIQSRLVLLDCGLRTWGVPRLTIAAVGMALTAAGESQIPTTCFRAIGAGVERADLATADGLTRHLSVVRHELDPREALPAFQQQRDIVAGLTDAVIVTLDTTFADHTFLDAIRESGLNNAFVAVVSHSGRFELWQTTQRGRRLVRTANFDPEELLRERSGATVQPDVPIIRNDIPGDLPALLRMNHMPVRLPVNVDMDRCWKAGHTICAITGDGRITAWDHQNRAPRQLSDQCPKGKLQLSGTLSDGTTIALVGRRNANALCLVRLVGSPLALESSPLREVSQQPIGFALHLDYLLLIARKTVDIVDARSGAWVATEPLPNPCTWKRDRYFLKHGQLLAMSFDGAHLVFEPVPKSDTASHDIAEGQVTLDIVQPPDGRSLRVRFRGIGLDQGNRLTLISRSGQQLGFVLSAGLILFVPNALKYESERTVLPYEGVGAYHVQPFLRTAGPPGANWELSVATFPDGSKAFLDSRGMLHLKSSLKETPEASLVLHEGLVSGWCSGLGVFGNDYFHDPDAPPCEQRDVFNVALLPFTRQLTWQPRLEYNTTDQ